MVEEGSIEEALYDVLGVFGKKGKWVEAETRAAGQNGREYGTEDVREGEVNSVQ